MTELSWNAVSLLNWQSGNTALCVHGLIAIISAQFKQWPKIPIVCDSIFSNQRWICMCVIFFLFNDLCVILGQKWTVMMLLYSDMLFTACFEVRANTKSSKKYVISNKCTEKKQVPIHNIDQISFSLNQWSL